jgi:hypothetical protein
MRRKRNLKYIGKLEAMKTERSVILSDVDAYCLLMFGMRRISQSSFLSDDLVYVQVGINKSSAWHIAYMRNNGVFRKICDVKAKPYILVLRQTDNVLGALTRCLPRINP